MRTRGEIENSEVGRMGGAVFRTPKEELILEVLLDIRDLLTKNDDCGNFKVINSHMSKKGKKKPRPC